MGLATAAIGAATGLYLFENCNYMVHVIAFFCLGMGLVSLVLCCSSFTSRPVIVSACSFCIFACAILQGVLWSAFGLYGIIFRPGTSPFLRLVVTPLPWFHYGASIHLIDNHILGEDIGRPSNASASSSPSAAAYGYGMEDWGFDLVVDEEGNALQSDGEIQYVLSDQDAIPSLSVSPEMLYNSTESYEPLDSNDGADGSSWGDLVSLTLGGEPEVSYWSKGARFRVREVLRETMFSPALSAIEHFWPEVSKQSRDRSLGSMHHAPPAHIVATEELVTWISGIKLQEMWEDGWQAAMPRWNASQARCKKAIIFSSFPTCPSCCQNKKQL